MRWRWLPTGITITAFGLATMATPGWAADEDVDVRSNLREGVWALAFGITQNFTLSSFDGALVSVKHHLSDRSAWRAGLSFSSEFTDETRTDTPDSSAALSVKRDQDTYFIGLNLQLMRYATPADRMSMFYAVGPSVGIGKVKTTYTDALDRESMTDSHFWTAGLAGGLGAEWFPSPQFGLHAEYVLSAGYIRTMMERTSPGGTSSEEIESESWRVRGTGVRFGLSAYF